MRDGCALIVQNGHRERNRMRIALVRLDQLAVFVENEKLLMFQIADAAFCILKGHIAELGNIKRTRRTAALALFAQPVDKTVDVAFTASAAHVQPPL